MGGMKLICHIEGSSIFASESVKVMQGDQLTIGRGTECDWVLNDPDWALSKQHCVISRTADGFTLTDTSTNGVFLNGERRPLGRGQSVPLTDGHQLLLGPYRVRLSIEPGAPAAQVAAPPPALTRAPETWIGAVPAAGFGEGRAPVKAGWDAPPDPAALGATGLLERGASDLFSPLAQQSERSSPVTTVIRMPTAKAVLPLDWDMAADENPLAPPKPATPAPAPAPQHNHLLQAFLTGAGLPADMLAAADQVAAFHEFGRMVRSSVLGLRNLLGSRKLAKAELRVEATTVKASGNNPLKLSPDAERALLTIAGQPLPGFLPGADAIDEGLRDIKAHELALVATVSILFSEIAAQLDPAVIKARVGEAGGFRAASRRAHWWDEYETAFATLSGGEAGTLMSRFAQIYAEQVRQSVLGDGTGG